ncbi:hypothetical protein [Anatilimnocola floriformis]|uniref:hypothetical protein n=1 Tax=Anatilimnocola floriformis TaxID=2948575 RepID=UPI0020C26B9B|nr:hypothetical protein [Anatilimnocola floriformis]
MNEHLPDQRELEGATSKKPRSSTGSSMHDVATRQAWLKLGAAVEANGRDGLDQDALLASLQAELITQPATPVEEKPQVDWSWAAVVIAATVLIVATAIGVISQQAEKIPNVAPAPQIAQPSPQPARIEQPAAPAVVVSPPETSSPDINPWTDLDEAINTTYTAIQQMSSQPSSFDRSLTDFDSQLKQLSADIAGESL